MATETLPFAPGRTRRTRPGQPRQAPDQNRPRRPQGPVSSPRHTRPLGAPARTSPKAPFLVLLVGLLGGALVSLLVISTTLDEGSYQINRLIQENNALNREREDLAAKVSNDNNPATLFKEASVLGMRQYKNLLFIDPAAGTISGSKPVTAP